MSLNRRIVGAAYRHTRPVSQPISHWLFGRLARRAAGERRPIRHSEAVFQYEAGRDAYRAYGASRVAWGQVRHPYNVWRHRRLGVGYAASIQCLSAGPELLYNDPGLRDAVSRDFLGEGVVVPWKWDIQHRGIGTLHGCTNHPLFREWIRGQVDEVMVARPDSFHIDDHLGTAETVGRGGGFCDFCMAGFRSYLQKHAARGDLEAVGVDDIATFDYRTVVRQHAASRREYLAVQDSIPLMNLFRLFHLEASAELIAELKERAREIAGRTVAVTANAVLPDVRHIRVLPHLDGLVAEMIHMNPDGSLNLPALAIAQDVARRFGKPFSYTAFGPEWAIVKARRDSQLVRLWIALAYSNGCWFLVPHPSRQWAYTPAGGHDIYAAPPEEFAPLYRFIQENARWFDDFEYADPASVSAPSGLTVRVRTDGTRVVIHLVNHQYDPKTREVSTVSNAEIALDPAAVPPGCTTARVMSWDGPDGESQLRRRDDVVALDVLAVGLWTMIVLEPA